MKVFTFIAKEQIQIHAIRKQKKTQQKNSNDMSNQKLIDIDNKKIPKRCAEYCSQRSFNTQIAKCNR